MMHILTHQVAALLFADHVLAASKATLYGCLNRYSLGVYGLQFVPCRITLWLLQSRIQRCARSKTSSNLVATNGWVASPAPPTTPPPLAPTALGHSPSAGSVEASAKLCGCAPLLDSPASCHPFAHAPLGLPSLLTPSPGLLCHQAHNSQPALAGESPDSVKSVTLAWHPQNPFSQQAVTAQGQTQGQQLQGHYQEPYQDQQNQWQQGQMRFQQPFQEPSRAQHGQGHFQGPLQGQFHAKLLQGQLWGQPVSLEEHRSNSQWDDLYRYMQSQRMYEAQFTLLLQLHGSALHNLIHQMPAKPV